MTLTGPAMEALIRKYFDACNAADADAIAACFVPDGVHYFPPGMYEGPFRGARTIAARWVDAVDRLGSYWTVDSVITDASTGRAVIEWSHFKTYTGVLLRGDEWYQFDLASGLIEEIRAYYASPQAEGLDRLELGGFDYAGRGFPTTSPVVRELAVPRAAPGTGA